MKFLRQFLIIMLFSFIGEGLNYIIPFPIPASIYGLVLLFVSLMTGIIKLDDVRDVVANWNQILGRIDQVSRSMLLDVRISVSEAGKLVLAFTQGMPAEYFKKEENQQVLIEAAGQLTGKEISLDVRFVENRQEMNALPELRNIIKNVEIEMLD